MYSEFLRHLHQVVCYRLGGGGVASLTSVAVATVGVLLLVMMSKPAFAQTVPGEPVIMPPENRVGREEFRPTWGLIPDVPSPSFHYNEVNHGRLIARASEQLNFLSVDSLIVSNTNGYQVVGPDGELFFLDNIEAPECGVQIIGQQIQTDDGRLVVSTSDLQVAVNPPSSFVHIGNVDFSNCF